jgi:hypothetical protein
MLARSVVWIGLCEQDSFFVLEIIACRTVSLDVVMDFGKSKSNWIFSFWTSLDLITLDVDVHMLN